MTLRSDPDERKLYEFGINHESEGVKDHSKAYQ
jgi:hypothetical protein